MREATIAANLVRLRKMKELTQEELAEKASLSRAGYRKIERGQATPQAETLRALAEALGVPQRELVVSVPALTHVRFRSLKRLKLRDQVLYAVGRWLRDLNDLEKLLGETSAGERFQEHRRKVLEAATDPIKRAAAARKAFGRDEEEPIRDICGLLESEGVKVWSVNVASDAFFGLSVAEGDGGPAVVVNTWDRFPVEHWIFSAAHELGHLLMHEGDYRVDEEEENDTTEQEANVFASHFLMPDHVFRREWDETAGSPLLDRVFKVKRMFRVSWRTVLYRVAEPLPDNLRTTLWRRINLEHQKEYGRPLTKYDEPWALGPDAYRGRGGETAGMEVHDFRGDRLHLLVRKAVIGEVITVHRAAEILQVSLRQMNDLAASWAAADAADR